MNRQEREQQIEDGKTKEEKTEDSESGTNEGESGQ
jgi:hypothetical protein